MSDRKTAWRKNAIEQLSECKQRIASLESELQQYRDAFAGADVVKVQS